MTKSRFSVITGVVLTCVASLCLAASSVSAAPLPATNLLSNGGFETPVVAGNFDTINAGGTMGAWSVDAGSVDHIGNYWTPAEGNQSVDMSGFNAGTISQTVNTGAGAYSLSFWMAGNTDGGNQTKQLEALVNGNILGIASFNTAGHDRNNMGWTKFTYNFVSAGGPTMVAFQSLENNAYGAALDNVSLQAVPEASTVALFAILLVGGIVMIRRRGTGIAQA